MRTPVWRNSPLLALFLITGVAILPKPAVAQENVLPSYLSDRGAGIPTSMFGTYISRGQLLLYPFFAYSLDNNMEYNPAILGFGLNQDFRGKYRSSEGVLFAAYGLTDWLALELEASYISANFEKSPSDPSTIPAKIEESGLGDVEGQVRLRLLRESDHRPEVFSYLEVTVPSQTDKLFIGAPDWDFRPGIGLVRGFSWGTMMTRVTVEYNREQSHLQEQAHLDLGEFAIEYLKRLSPAWRVNLAIEGGEGGAPDEWDLIAGVHWRMTDFAFLKLDNALGLSSKATDWAPQIGIMFSFPN